MVTFKSSYGVILALAFLLVRTILAFDYNTATFPTCGTSCRDTQRLGLVALYQATQVQQTNLS